VYAMADTNIFSDWLQAEMDNRGLTQAELARLAGVTRSAINGVLTGNRGPGNDLCVAISRALKLPPELVFRKAGLLPPVPQITEYTEEILHLINKLPPEDQEEILELLRFKIERKTANINEKPPSRKKNPARSVLNN